MAGWELLGEQGTDLVGIRGLQLLEEDEGLAQVGPRLEGVSWCGLTPRC